MKLYRVTRIAKFTFRCSFGRLRYFFGNRIVLRFWKGFARRFCLIKWCGRSFEKRDQSVDDNAMRDPNPNPRRVNLGQRARFAASTFCYFIHEIVAVAREQSPHERSLINTFDDSRTMKLVSTIKLVLFEKACRQRFHRYQIMLFTFFRPNRSNHMEYKTTWNFFPFFLSFNNFK